MLLLCLGKELVIYFAVRGFRGRSSIYMCATFPFGFEAGMCDLIALVLEYCLSFYLTTMPLFVIQQYRLVLTFRRHQFIVIFAELLN